jgi:hypothetical protein
MEVANIPGFSDHYLLLSKRKCDMMIPVGNPKSDSMTEKADVLQGTLLPAFNLQNSSDVCLRR